MSGDSCMRVAFLGLGIMGRPMAASLVRAGNEVAVWNRTPKDVEGARTAASAADAVNGSDVVWICVSDTKAVESVLFGPQGVESAIAAGAIVVDSSTISPSAELQFAERLRAKGVEYVDAPITGSKAAAESASLIFMAGGDPAVLARLDPLFKAMGKQVFRMGDTSKGQAAKLGVNVESLLPLIQASMVRSGVVEYKAPFVLKRDFSPNFPLRLMLKDIHLALNAAKEARVKLPALETVQDVYEMAAEEGHQDLDYAATLTLLEKWAGVEVKGAA